MVLTHKVGNSTLLCGQYLLRGVRLPATLFQKLMIRIDANKNQSVVVSIMQLIAIRVTRNGKS